MDVESQVHESDGSSVDDGVADSGKEGISVCDSDGSGTEGRGAGGAPRRGSTASAGDGARKPATSATSGTTAMPADGRNATLDSSSGAKTTPGGVVYMYETSFVLQQMTAATTSWTNVESVKIVKFGRAVNAPNRLQEEMSHYNSWSDAHHGRVLRVPYSSNRGDGGELAMSRLLTLIKQSQADGVVFDDFVGVIPAFGTHEVGGDESACDKVEVRERGLIVVPGRQLER
jgi:hypothetical protein